jgi:hypothetical protein
MSWDHQRVYNALVKLGNRPKKTKNNWYAKLYEQEHNCAILYGPDSQDYRPVPLHLHPGREGSWDPKYYFRILPAIKSVRLESKSKSQSNQSFLHCKVDWNRLAVALHL